MKFKRVYIEILNTCNLNCSFCSKLEREDAMLSKQQFEYIIKQVKPFADFVYLHVKGEPLMHPQLESLLNICYENGIKANITTNATLLNKNKEILFNSKSLRQINFSLHAANQQKGDISEYIQSVLEFSKLASKNNVFVVLRLWNLDKDEKTNGQSVEIMRMIEKAYDLKTPLLKSMGGHKSVKIAPYTFVGWEQEFKWPSLKAKFVSDSGYCYGMRYQIAILADGTVVPCCLDANGECQLGNVFKTPFADIINSKKAQDIKQGFENFKAVDELCKRCSYRTRFNQYIKS